MMDHLHTALRYLKTFGPLVVMMLVAAGLFALVAELMNKGEGAPVFFSAVLAQPLGLVLVWIYERYIIR